MQGSYKQLASDGSARRLIGALALAWLSFGTVGLLLLLSARLETGSYRSASFVVAAFSVGSGALAPVRGRLVDRFGPGLLLILALGYAAGLSGLRASERVSAPTWSISVLACLAGLSAPPLVAFLRGRWVLVVPAEVVRQGYAITSMIADTGLVLGPVIAAALVYWEQNVAFVVCIVPVVWSAFAATRLSTQSSVSEARTNNGLVADDGRSGSLSAFRPFVLTSIGIGGAFGVSEVAVPARAAHWGHAHLAGVLLGLFAVGSIAGAAVSGNRKSGPSLRRLFTLAALALGAGFAGLALAPSALVLGALLVPVGMFSGAATVVLYELVDDLVLVSRTTEAMTWVTTAQAIGLAVGSLAAGVAANSVGVRWAFVGAGLVLCALAWVARIGNKLTR